MASNRKAMEDALSEMRGNDEHYEMMSREGAKMYFRRYKHLVEEGFTEVQAMAIVVHRGLDI